MRSLFVVSLPRALSSLTYRVARQALGLAEPAWTSDGEVLNSDRYVMYGDPRHQGGRKFTRPAEEPGIAGRLFDFLDQVVQPCGFAYKDVVQPFVVAAWLTRADRGLAVLRIRRPLVDVALSMLERRWVYPARQARVAPGEGLETALLRGLLAAEAALDAVPAVEVEYDALVSDETALTAALEELAPAQDLREVRYLGPQFGQYRENRLARRRGEPYRLLRAKLDAVRSTVAG